MTFRLLLLLSLAGCAKVPSDAEAWPKGESIRQMEVMMAHFPDWHLCMTANQGGLLMSYQEAVCGEDDLLTHPEAP